MNDDQYLGISEEGAKKLALEINKRVKKDRAIIDDSRLFDEINCCEIMTYRQEYRISPQHTISGLEEVIPFEETWLEVVDL